jgi:hypothetical protein
MATLRISGDTSGYIDLRAPTTGAANVFTFPATTGTILTDATTSGINASAISVGTLGKSRLPTGSVLQVVQGTLASDFTTSSTSFVHNGITATITPSSASNKVLVFAHTFTSTNANLRSAFVTLFRGATNLGHSTEGFGASRSDSGGGLRSSFDICYLDSPNTTSPTVYEIYVRSSSGEIQVSPFGSAIQTIVLMEIAG